MDLPIAQAAGVPCLQHKLLVSKLMSDNGHVSKWVGEVLATGLAGWAQWGELTVEGQEALLAAVPQIRIRGSAAEIEADMKNGLAGPGHMNTFDLLYAEAS